MLQRFKSFLTDPYDPDMDALDWFLFIGLVLCCLIAWRMIFRTVGDHV